MVLNELININSSEQGSFLFLVSTLLGIVQTNSNSSLTRINECRGPVTRDCLAALPVSVFLPHACSSFCFCERSDRFFSERSANLPRSNWPEM